MKDSYEEPKFWCWICFRWVREYDYLLWSRGRRVARRHNEIKWVTIRGVEVPICPYCGNLLKNQSRRLILKSWMKYGLIGILIFFILWILAKIVELAKSSMGRLGVARACSLFRFYLITNQFYI